jgi:hypothetical protein
MPLILPTLWILYSVIKSILELNPKGTLTDVRNVLGDYGAQKYFARRV